jgi:hypothetical protein
MNSVAKPSILQATSIIIVTGNGTRLREVPTLFFPGNFQTPYGGLHIKGEPVYV